VSQHSGHRQPAVVLYVFSGPHGGARLELPEGNWLLGSDDSCDLILAGLQPRHALLAVSAADSDEPSVTLSPLDGPVRLAGEEEIRPDADGTQPPLAGPAAGRGWFLGQTCFAWNLPGAVQAVLLPDELMRPAAAVTREQEDTERDAESEPAANMVSTTAAAGSENANTVGSTSPPLPLQMPPKPPARRVFAIPVRAVLLSLLIVLLLSMSVALTPSFTEPEEYPAVVEKYLAESGISGLTVTPHKQGVQVRGTVDDDAVMVQLYGMARALHFPIYLDVGVREDVLRAIRSSLGIRGFHPQVEFVEKAGRNQVRIAAYMKDASLEASAFSALSAEVKGLSDMERNIVHEKVLAPALDAALKDAGLTSVRALFLPGQIDFTGSFRPEDEALLRRIREDMATRFDVPLYGASSMGGGSSRSAPGGTALRLPHVSPMPEAGQATDDGTDPLGGLRVTGVTMMPMRFVTTADGKRLFEGAVLPGGCILEGISTKALTLRRGGQIFTYTLRGSQ